MNNNARGVRIDKWLWAARFFKTRSLAQTAVSGGKVRLKDERVKVAKEVKVGDTLSVRIGEYEWGVVVTALSEKRGSAEIARTLGLFPACRVAYLNGGRYGLRVLYGMPQDYRSRSFGLDSEHLW